MKWPWLCAVIGTVLLAGCVASTPVAQDSGLAQIQFLENYFDDDPIESEATQYGLDLLLYGVYAIDKNTVFLFGQLGLLRVKSIHRAVLLRSGDGGQHWAQVLSTDGGESFYHVAFIDGGIGWALAVYNVEDLSIGDLYRSWDYGKTWRGPIAIGSVAGLRPWGMKFADKSNGQIVFDHFTASPTDSFGIISTTDGGTTWKETLSVRVSEEDYQFKQLKKQYIGPSGGDYGSHWSGRDDFSNIYRAKGQDGSEWHFYYYEPTNEYIVLSRPDAKSAWRVASTIYNQFTYDKGHVSQP